MRVSPGTSPGLSQAYADLEAASIGNPLAHVARVLMEAKDRGEETEDQAYDAARGRVEQATAQEVASMHDAADEMFRGALTGAALTVAGAGLQAGAIQMQGANQNVVSAGSKYGDIGAKLMTSGAPYASQVFQSRAESRRADAAQHRGDGATAQVDASRHDEQRKRAIGDRDDARSALRTASSELHESRMAQTRIIQG